LLMSDLLKRRSANFVLWRPAHTSPVPRLIIGIFVPGNPASLRDVREIYFVQSSQFPELWEIPCTDCGLIDGQVYHYWFRVKDSSPEPDRDKIIDATDPFATTVDWRVLAPQLPAPY